MILPISSHPASLEPSQQESEDSKSEEEEDSDLGEEASEFVRRMTSPSVLAADEEADEDDEEDEEEDEDEIVYTSFNESQKLRLQL